MLKGKLSVFLYLIIIITCKKFLERCDTMLTCDSCTRYTSNCGWCHTDGICKSGNEIGPSIGSCKYSEWETTRCRSNECDKINSLVPCVTQKDCYWCKKDIIGTCFNRNRLYDNKCNDRITLELYVKSPDSYRDNLNNILKSDINKLSKGNNQVAEYNNFISKLKNFIDSNKVSYELYNSINNPNGVFKYQLTKDKDKSLDIHNIHFPLFNITNNTETLIDNNSTQDIAFELLRSMFLLYPNITITDNYKGSIYYLVIENFIKEKWIHYLNMHGIDLEKLHKAINITEEIKSNSTKYVNKQIKKSLIYPLKFDNNDISHFNKSNSGWNSLPGSYFKLNAFLPSTVVLLQKVKLNGKGSNYDSVFIHNDEPISTLTVVQNKNFNRIDLNNIIIRKLSPGFNSFMLSYLSDFISYNDEHNLIQTSVIEFPSLDQPIIKKSDFNLDDKTGIWFGIKDMNINIKEKANYIIIYHISSKSNKNIIFRLSKKDDKNEELNSSTSIFIPSSGVLNNIAGFAIINLSETFIELKAKYLFDSNRRYELITNGVNELYSFMERMSDQSSEEPKKKKKKKKHKPNNHNNTSIVQKNIFNTTENATKQNDSQDSSILNQESEEDQQIEEIITTIDNHEIQKPKTLNEDKISDYPLIDTPLNITNLKELESLFHSRPKEDFFDIVKDQEKIFSHKNDLNEFINNIKNDKNNQYTEKGEITLLKLPQGSQIYSLVYKGFLDFKANKEFNLLPNMKKTFKLTKDTNILLQVNIIISTSYNAKFEFKLHINGMDDCDSYMLSLNEHIINQNTFIINKLSSGEHTVELLYQTSIDGQILMNSNDWDIISMNMLLLDIE